MQEWNEVVQCMIEWIEEHLDQNPVLSNLSREVGYSPWYCSVMFHDVTGVTLKNYVAGRRLSLATVEIRDTQERILDVAIKYGYSSQEAFSRAFKDRYGCTPAAYRKNPVPIPMTIHKHVLFPQINTERLREMQEKRLDVAVEKLAWGFDPGQMDYEWNEDACPVYQRHYPEKLGYQVVRPIRRRK